MANNLNIDIKDKVVIVNPKHYFLPYVFLCKGGFGCSPITNGSCVGGEFLIDKEEARIEGEEVLRLATDKEIADRQVSRETLEETLKSIVTDFRDLKKRNSKLMRSIEEIYSKRGEKVHLNSDSMLTKIQEELDQFYDEKYAEDEDFY